MTRPRPSEELSARVRFRQFGLRTLFVTMTLCAAVFALARAFGPGGLLVLLATVVLLGLVFILKYIEHRQSTGTGVRHTSLEFALTFVFLLSLAFTFLALVKLAVSWLIV